MITDYTEGRMCIKLGQLRNPLVAMAVKKYMSKIEGIETVSIAGGEIEICYNPAILPTRVLLERGRADLGKYGIELEIPPEIMAQVQDL